MTSVCSSDDAWHGLRAMSEERRAALEDAVGDLRDFRECEEQLNKWFSQKEKLMDVLGPVAMEPSLLKSQMEQVKVCQCCLFSNILHIITHLSMYHC